ncbi:MAG: hypothetical protein FWH07_05120 [Oscillospiraceae bacterium]|nr:hypothetical protein [Oscillospiraceae bacterium]
MSIKNRIDRLEVTANSKNRNSILFAVEYNDDGTIEYDNRIYTKEQFETFCRVHSVELIFSGERDLED